MKNYYKDKVKKTAAIREQYKDCFCFAVVADSHLDNSLDDTIENIKAVHESVGFSCLVHLGDFLNGNLSHSYTKKILNEQMELFRSAVCGAPFYPVQGNHDGYKNMISDYPNIITDEEWHQATAFVDEYSGVVRTGDKPYFFVDLAAEKIRLVILCSFYYTYNNGAYEKIYDTDPAQIEWVKNTALDVNGDWTVLIFSHDTPFESFNENCCINNPRENGNALMDAVKIAGKNKGFELPAWFVGHFHGDYKGTVNGLNFILTASETAYVPWLWDMPAGGYYPERSLGTDTEDLWDCVVLDREKRKVRMFRFGAGADRELDY